MEIPPNFSRSEPNSSKSLLPRRPWGPSVVYLVPAEILSEIFLLVVEAWGGYRNDLMLVCWRWHDIILSTPAIPSPLRIRRATRKEAVQAFLDRRKSRLDVIVDMDDETDGNEFDPDDFHACFMAAAQAASRWRSLRLISPPPRGECLDQRILQPLKHLEWREIGSGFGNLVELLMTAIGRTATPRFTEMNLADHTAVLYLVQPSYAHISHSIRYLTINLSKRSMNSPVDVLPYLPRLEEFIAHHLYLPIYPPDTSLPLIRTLKHLSLQSVSVQWMGGRAFPALWSCSITFPHHADTLQPLQSVSMPSCWNFQYDSNDLSPLRHFNLPRLEELRVKSGQWTVWRGNLQLITVHSLLVANSQNLTSLNLSVPCGEQLLVCILRLMPTLQELSLGLPSPNALSERFFQAFILRAPDKDSAPRAVWLSRQAVDPLCPSLGTLTLSYKRWLRGPDNKRLIPVFSDIVGSRQQKKYRFKLSLKLDEMLGLPSWQVARPSQDFQFQSHLSLGISYSHAIIRISTTLPVIGFVPLPFKEVDYLHLHHIPHNLPIDFHFTLDHMELSLEPSGQPILPTSRPCNLPLFHALRALVVNNTNPSFLAGHTFHRLERCRVVGPSKLDRIPSQGLFTEMPVCTRLDMDDPVLLATFKLPQIRELALDFSGSERGMIWERHISVNANLSGLKLLHIRGQGIGEDLVQVLKSLSLLETLIVSTRVDVATFSALNLARWEGQTFAVHCPMLQSLQIEDTGLSEMSKLTLDLKDIVNLRRACGFPLKSLTLHRFSSKPRRKFELLGVDGSFTMEISVLAEDVRRFELDI